MNALDNAIKLASQTPAAWGIKQLQNAGRNAATAVSNWATPPALSPIPEQTAQNLRQSGGIKQAVNNIAAYATFQPQLVRPFNQVQAAPPEVNRVVAQPIQQKQNALSNAYGDFINTLHKQIASPTPTQAPPLPTPTMNPSIPTRDELIQAIQLGSAGTPVATMAAQMVDQSQKYPIFQKHPFVPVMHSHLESGGLRDFSTKPKLVYRPKQGFGWGAVIPDNKYNPTTIEQALQDLITGVGGRTAAEGFTQDQINTSKGYEDFRNTGDINPYLMKFAGPVSAQNPQAGEKYVGHAKFVLNKFNEILDNIMKKRGGSYPNRY